MCKGCRAPCRASLWLSWHPRVQAWYCLEICMKIPGAGIWDFSHILQCQRMLGTDAVRCWLLLAWGEFFQAEPNTEPLPRGVSVAEAAGDRNSDQLCPSLPLCLTAPGLLSCILPSTGSLLLGFLHLPGMGNANVSTMLGKTPQPWGNQPLPTAAPRALHCPRSLKLGLPLDLWSVQGQLGWDLEQFGDWTKIFKIPSPSKPFHDSVQGADNLPSLCSPTVPPVPWQYRDT